MNFFREQQERQKNVTGVYHVSGPFAWTESFNSFALGGITIVCDGNLTIKSRVQPVRNPSIPDSYSCRISLVSLHGDIMVETGDLLECALLAPEGKFSNSSPNGLDIKGLIAVKTINLKSLENASEKKVVYDSSHDWNDLGQVWRGFRIMLEETPQFSPTEPNSGILFETDLGTFGSASELIYAPLSGKPATDSNWLYETLPDGTLNPRFRQVFSPPTVTNSVPFPSDLSDSAEILGNAKIIEIDP